MFSKKEPKSRVPGREFCRINCRHKEGSCRYKYEKYLDEAIAHSSLEMNYLTFDTLKIKGYEE